MTNYAKYIDHTLLAMDATYDQIQKICDEAIKHEFYSVCVNSSYVPFVAKKLAGSPVKTCSVIGFPLGAMLTNAKAFETQAAIHEGAQEIDMVINVGWLKSGKSQEVENDIQSVYTACNGTPLKVIIETCLLTQDEIVKVCEICKKINVAFVKTSTGFSQSGAKKEDVELMKQTVGSDIQVKASGGVRTQETADIMIKAGATRLGTSSGIAIISGNNTSTQSY